MGLVELRATSVATNLCIAFFVPQNPGWSPLLSPPDTRQLQMLPLIFPAGCDWPQLWLKRTGQAKDNALLGF